MAHMGERGASGCSRSGGAASTQMDDLEVCSFCSGDFVCFDDVSVFPGQAYGKRQSGSQQSPDGGMYSVEWSSDRLQEMMCPPLPGQVPVEPTVTSTHRTAQGAVEASPANKNSTASGCSRSGGAASTQMDDLEFVSSSLYPASHGNFRCPNTREETTRRP
ncbi:hypothetical protein PO909_017276 [Leuciscus waleckii]